VLALLALPFFPVLAQAETVYTPESPNLPNSGGGTPTTHVNNPGGSGSSPHASQSNVPPGAAGGGTGHSQHESSGSNGGASGGTNPSSPSGGGEGKGKSGNGATTGQNPPGSVQIGEPKSSVSDSGGSSPLVPILIAVAVLAAISVGAVLVRQRRGSAGGFSLKRG